MSKDVVFRMRQYRILKKTCCLIPLLILFSSQHCMGIVLHIYSISNGYRYELGTLNIDVSPQTVSTIYSAVIVSPGSQTTPIQSHYPSYHPVIAYIGSQLPTKISAIVNIPPNSAHVASYSLTYTWPNNVLHGASVVRFPGTTQVSSNFQYSCTLPCQPMTIPELPHINLWHLISALLTYSKQPETRQFYNNAQVRAPVMFHRCHPSTGPLINWTVSSTHFDPVQNTLDINFHVDAQGNYFSLTITLPTGAPADFNNILSVQLFQNGGLVMTMENASALTPYTVSPLHQIPQPQLNSFMPKPDDDKGNAVATGILLPGLHDSTHFVH